MGSGDGGGQGTVGVSPGKGSLTCNGDSGDGGTGGTGTAGYAVYCRLSRKPSGRKRRRNDADTVERQEALIRKYAAEHGLAVSEAHVYVDNHRSAWKARGPRPAWDAMIAAGRRGEFPGVLAYKLDRFSRNVRDAEDLVDLAGNRRVVVDGPNSGRIDLSTAHGRRTFREAAVQASAESDNASERIRDALAERAAGGLQIGGGRLYGFEVVSEVREYDDDLQPVQRPAEVAVVREAARRVLDGETWSAVAADLNERGLATARGGRWTGGSLARVVAAPRMGGRVMLNGVEVARNEGEPVLDEDTYARVQALVASRRRGRRPSGRWKLTGAVHCGSPRCEDPGHPMAGYQPAGGPRRYVCAPANGGCGMSVLAEPVERIVRARVLRDVNDPGLVAALAGETAALNDAKIAAAAEVNRLDEMLADLEVKRVAGLVRQRAYEQAKVTLDRLIAAAEAELKRLGGEGGGRRVDALTGEGYDRLTAAEAKMLVEDLRLRVTVLPYRQGTPRNRFDPERVVIEP